MIINIIEKNGTKVKYFFQHKRGEKIPLPSGLARGRNGKDVFLKTARGEKH